MDPWANSEGASTTSSLDQQQESFEDNFAEPQSSGSEKLPDSEEYLGKLGMYVV